MEEFDMKELADLIRSEIEKTYTIEEAIKEKQDENKLIKDSFDSLWNEYNTANSVRKEEIKNLTLFKYRYLIIKQRYLIRNFLLMVIRNDAYYQISDLMKIVDSSNTELKNEKEFLILVRDTIKKLQLNNASNCNYDLSLLLSYLFEKYVLIYNYTSGEILACNSRLNGISTQGSSKYVDEKKELDDKINDIVLKLELK